MATFRGASHKQNIYFNRDFHADIDCFIQFLPSFNGITFIGKNAVDDTQSLFLDASLTGMGAVWRDHVYATPTREIPGFVLTIVHLEMFNVLLALRVWGREWRHSSVKYFCDNHSVVQVVRTGKTRDPLLALCIRNIWLQAAVYDINLVIEHIAGKDNRIADTLSHIHSTRMVDENTLLNLLKSYYWELCIYNCRSKPGDTFKCIGSGSHSQNKKHIDHLPGPHIAGPGPLMSPLTRHLYCSWTYQLNSQFILL